MKRPGALEIQILQTHPSPIHGRTEGREGGQEEKTKNSQVIHQPGSKWARVKAFLWLRLCNGILLAQSKYPNPQSRTLRLPTECLGTPSISLTTLRQMECEISQREGRRDKRPLVLPHFSNPAPNLKYRFTKPRSPWTARGSLGT